MSALFTDSYASLTNEAGDFLIPQTEGVIDAGHIKGELSELVSGKKPGRTGRDQITLFKSLGIATEDVFSAWHIYKKMKGTQ
jgi:ornithine cyclodeaminase